MLAHFNMRDLWRKRYGEHRFNAEVRGVEFRLTFEEWKTLWIESGKWEQRGPRRGQYVMARHGDQGAYEMGNVRVCLARENFDEADHRVFGERNAASGKNYWATMTPEKRERRRLAVSEKLKGRPKSAEHCAAISRARAR